MELPTYGVHTCSANQMQAQPKNSQVLTWRTAPALRQNHESETYHRQLLKFAGLSRASLKILNDVYAHRSQLQAPKSDTRASVRRGPLGRY